MISGGKNQKACNTGVILVILIFTELPCSSSSSSLASFPGRFVGGGKMAWYRLFAHARNIPFIQRIFSSIIL